MRRLLPLLFTILFLLSFPSLLLADDPTTDPQLENPTVSASVPSQTPETTPPGDTTPPTSPILLRPADGSATGDSTPEFVWRQSTDASSNTIHYTFYLDGVATYLGVSNDNSSSGAGYTATIDGTEVRLIPSSSLPDGTYTWRIVASDPSGNQASSTTWTLTIDTQAPFLLLSQLDAYEYPLLTEESSFEIAGPKAVDFTILTEPYASVRLTLTPLNSDSDSLSLTATTDHTGTASFAPHLATGLYSVSISATDHVNLVSVLPTFLLTLTTPQVSLTLPPLPGLPPTLSFPTPAYLFPATIQELQARPTYLPTVVGLLSFLLFLLLLYVRRRRPNLILLDSLGHPLHDVLITHSNPHSPGRSAFSTLHTTSFKSYLPHLTRFSTLTLRTQSHSACLITVLSLSVKRSVYTIVL